MSSSPQYTTLALTSYQGTQPVTPCRPVPPTQRPQLVASGLAAWLRLVVAFMVLTGSAAFAGAPIYEKKPSWVETVLDCRRKLDKSRNSPEARGGGLANLTEKFRCDFPVESDWVLQDWGADFYDRFFGGSGNDMQERMISSALQETSGHSTEPKLTRLPAGKSTPSFRDSGWLGRYVKACESRRQKRLMNVHSLAPRFVFTKRPTLQPSFFAYTEGQSDAQNERHFAPGAEICLFEMEGSRGSVRTLLTDKEGSIRDPAVSWDGKSVLFAWKKSLDNDDYHLYELNVASERIRQITSGVGFADYEPAFLPNGDIIFSSTRCVQTVDCWWTEVSNLYTCDPDGRYLRRLGFDQVHAIFPSVMDDGRVIYTRWDYNDRGQIFPQPLFQMNPDGTGQSEFYGNNSWFPTTIAHARGIPASQRVLAILCGHHSTQAGKLAVIDPAKGRQENEGVQLVAPYRETKAERIDSYGQDGELFQYPYPLNETECLVTFAPKGWENDNPRIQQTGGAEFSIYWMDLTGRRELLVTDPRMPCQQAVPLVPRRAPQGRPSSVDYQQTNGTYYVQDVYAGPGVSGLPRGTIKNLRVVALEFRAAGIRNNGSTGPGGAALVSTPISVGNGSWDVKMVLGCSKVHEDGSAYFVVPARLPVYFQLLDERNRTVQTMRSWTTLQPGESQSCAGCHESKNSTPSALKGPATLALRAGPQALVPFYGPPRGFSFTREIQPILERHCIRCHNDPHQRIRVDRLADPVTQKSDPIWWDARQASRGSTPQVVEVSSVSNSSFSLRSEPVHDKVAGRAWSEAYVNLTSSSPSDYYEAREAYFGIFDARIVNWIGSQSIPAPMPPFAAGAATSDLIPLLAGGHGGVKLSGEEMDKIACWIDLLVPYCGDYTEANTWSSEEKQKYQRYLDKRRRMEQIENHNIEEFIANRENLDKSPVNSHRN